MGLSVVTSRQTPRRLATLQEAEDFEQELVDQHALASLGAGVTDRQVAAERSHIFEFLRFLDRPLWMAGPQDADRFLLHQRRDRGLAKLTVVTKGAPSRASTPSSSPATTVRSRRSPATPSSSPSTSSTGLRGRTTGSGEFRHPRRRSKPSSQAGASRWPTPGSSCRRPATTWRRRCGVVQVCGSTRR